MNSLLDRLFKLQAMALPRTEFWQHDNVHHDGLLFCQPTDDGR